MTSSILCKTRRNPAPDLLCVTLSESEKFTDKLACNNNFSGQEFPTFTKKNGYKSDTIAKGKRKEIRNKNLS